MTQKQISDLTATDRLRTGTLVEVQDPINGSGNITVDNLMLGPQWDTPSQITDGTDAVEVEAATRAARMRFYTDEAVLPQAGWSVGRYMLSTGGGSAFTALTTAAVANGMILVFGWACASGICIPKKVTGSMVTGALSGTRAGSCDMALYHAQGLSTNVGTTNVVSPGSQGGNNLGGVSPARGNLGLKAGQAPSQAHVQILAATTTAQASLDTAPIGIAKAGAISVAGSTQIQNATLYDWLVAEQPLILTPGSGFQVNVNLPAAATSQTVWWFLNIQWDEWTPIAPGDR